MKKYLILLLAACTCVCLAGCGGKKDKEEQVVIEETVTEVEEDQSGDVEEVTKPEDETGLNNLADGLPGADEEEIQEETAWYDAELIKPSTDSKGTFDCIMYNLDDTGAVLEAEAKMFSLPVEVEAEEVAVDESTKQVVFTVNMDLTEWEETYSNFFSNILVVDLPTGTVINWTSKSDAYDPNLADLYLEVTKKADEAFTKGEMTFTLTCPAEYEDYCLLITNAINDDMRGEHLNLNGYTGMEEYLNAGEYLAFDKSLVKVQEDAEAEEDNADVAD